MKLYIKHTKYFITILFRYITIINWTSIYKIYCAGSNNFCSSFITYYYCCIFVSLITDAPADVPAINPPLAHKFFTASYIGLPPIILVILNWSPPLKNNKFELFINSTFLLLNASSLVLMSNLSIFLIPKLENTFL